MSARRAWLNLSAGRNARRPIQPDLSLNILTAPHACPAALAQTGCHYTPDELPPLPMPDCLLNPKCSCCYSTEIAESGPRKSWVPYLLLWLGLVFGAPAGAAVYPTIGLGGLWLAAAVCAVMTVVAARGDDAAGGA
jgi:hypothetical protein